ncbi:MAG TPA: hypothetical protein VEK32_15965 [Thermodesulfobacteriota bacterium]|nr:hypothetical protein [Thermodesulfobacteriota bacterium]
MKPILLEIVTKVLTSWGECRRCRLLFDQAGLDQKFYHEEMEGYPPDLKEEVTALSDWLQELKRLYKHRLLIKLIDVQSPLGIYKSLRHRVRTYPTFIVEGKETYAGWDKGQLERLLDKYVDRYVPRKFRPLGRGAS